MAAILTPIAAITSSPSKSSPLLVDQQRTVAVAIERDTDLRALAQHRLAKLLRMQRAAAEIDVLAVGIDAQCDDVGAQFGQRVGTDLIGRAVGAIDHQLEPVEGQPRAARSP